MEGGHSSGPDSGDMGRAGAQAQHNGCSQGYRLETRPRTPSQNEEHGQRPVSGTRTPSHNGDGGQRVKTGDISASSNGGHGRRLNTDPPEPDEEGSKTEDSLPAPSLEHQQNRTRQKKFVKNFKQLPSEEVVLKSKTMYNQM